MEEIKSMSKEENEEDVILPGFRFHPTDEELVGFYLRRKVENKIINIELIKHIDIYKYDPWDLPKVGDKEMYYFCMRGRKYKNSVRPNRVTRSGFWKATGIDKPVYNSNNNNIIGLKKSLVYYRGTAGKGTKSDWMMHEFRLPPTSNTNHQAEVWTLCRIMKRTTSNYKRSSFSSQEVKHPVISYGDASSKACSQESDENTIDHDHSTSFKDMSFQQQNYYTNNYTTQMDEFRNPHESTILPSSSSSFWNTNSAQDEYLFSDHGNKWDDLKSIVDLATMM